MAGSRARGAAIRGPGHYRSALDTTQRTELATLAWLPGGTILATVGQGGGRWMIGRGPTSRFGRRDQRAMSEKPWPVLALTFAVGLAALGGGCRSSGTTAEWQTLSYKESDVLTLAQQVGRDRDLQSNSAAVTDGRLVVRGEIPSNMITERQRQAVQDAHARTLRELVERQRQEAQVTYDQADQIKGGGARTPSRE